MIQLLLVLGALNFQAAIAQEQSVKVPYHFSAIAYCPGATPVEIPTHFQGEIKAGDSLLNWTAVVSPNGLQAVDDLEKFFGLDFLTQDKKGKLCRTDSVDFDEDGDLVFESKYTNLGNLASDTYKFRLKANAKKNILEAKLIIKHRYLKYLPAGGWATLWHPVERADQQDLRPAILE